MPPRSRTANLSHRRDRPSLDSKTQLQLLAQTNESQSSGLSEPEWWKSQHNYLYFWFGWWLIPKKLGLGLLIRWCLSLFLILIILGLVLGLTKKAWARAQAQKWRLKFIEPLICREKKTRAWRQRSRRSNRGLDFFPFPPTSFMKAAADEHRCCHFFLYMSQAKFFSPPAQSMHI